MRKPETIVKQHLILSIVAGVIGMLAVVAGFLFSMSIITSAAFGWFLVSLPILVGGTILTHVSARAYWRVIRFRRYKQLILEDKMLSLREIARLIERNPAFVAGDLQSMAITGYFPGLQIDDKAEKIIWLRVL